MATNVPRAILGPIMPVYIYPYILEIKKKKLLVGTPNYPLTWNFKNEGPLFLSSSIFLLSFFFFMNCSCSWAQHVWCPFALALSEEMGFLIDPLVSQLNHLHCFLFHGMKSFSLLLKKNTDAEKLVFSNIKLRNKIVKYSFLNSHLI